MKIVSDIYGPVIGAVYLLMLPVCVLVLISGLTAATPDTLLVVFGIVGTIMGLFAFPKGLTLFHQHVEADEEGLTVAGRGGFHLPWDDIASLQVASTPRTGNVRVTSQPGVKFTSEYLYFKTGRRAIGIAPERTQEVCEFAGRHGVQLLGLVG